MKIETITYKRIHNLGNYESEHLEMTASLGDEDDPKQVTQNLMEQVKRQLFPNIEPESLDTEQIF